MAFVYKLLRGIGEATSMTIGDQSEKDANHFNARILSPLGYREDVASMAKNICQSVQYCLSDEHRGLGARAAIFPLKVAIETLHDAHCEKELRWAHNAMERAVQTGVQIMKHLPVPMTDHGLIPG